MNCIEQKVAHNMERWEDGCRNANLSGRKGKQGEILMSSRIARGRTLRRCGQTLQGLFMQGTEATCVFARYVVLFFSTLVPHRSKRKREKYGNMFDRTCSFGTRL